jgi:hypothetical protein
MDEVEAQREIIRLNEVIKRLENRIDAAVRYERARMIALADKFGPDAPLTVAFIELSPFPVKIEEGK